MNRELLKEEFIDLYNKYGVDSTKLESMSNKEVARGAKGLLADFEKQRKTDCSKNDRVRIKDIYFYFC